MLIESGAEVVPSIGDPSLLQFDSQYNNENSPLYPQWRKSTTIPPPIIEQLRNVDFTHTRGAITSEEAELFNRWIDVMYIASFPDIVNNVMDWFQGYIIFRVFGQGDYGSYTQVMNYYSLSMNRFGSHDKYIWSPILYNLDYLEDPRITRNKFYLNAFVSPERMGYKWRFEQSNPMICTTISYLDRDHPARDVYMEFSARFADMPYFILGKNKSDHQGRVRGYVGHDKFYSQISSSRMFIYLGFSTYFHLHFTPLEAIAMGVPVFFLEKSGLTQEARDNGVTNEYLSQCGMCESIADIRQRIIRYFNDRAYLEELSNRQYKLFMKIFGRNIAIERASAFVGSMKRYIQKNRTLHDSGSVYYNKLNAAPRPVLKSNLPTFAGQFMQYSVASVRGLTGTAVYDRKGNFISRRATVGIDAPGMIIGEYIGAMEAGLYVFTIRVKSEADYHTRVGTFSAGTWIPEYTLYSYAHLESIKAGDTLISLRVDVSPSSAPALKELRFQWDGTTNIAISTIYVDKLT